MKRKTTFIYRLNASSVLISTPSCTEVVEDIWRRSLLSSMMLRSKPFLKSWKCISESEEIHDKYGSTGSTFHFHTKKFLYVFFFQIRALENDAAHDPVSCNTGTKRTNWPHLAYFRSGRPHLRANFVTRFFRTNHWVPISIFVSNLA